MRPGGPAARNAVTGSFLHTNLVSLGSERSCSARRGLPFAPLSPQSFRPYRRLGIGVTAFADNTASVANGNLLQTSGRSSIDTKTTAVVEAYVKLWPRDVFYVSDECLKLVKDAIGKSGVYILYQDFDVFYIGQTGSLFERLQDHARKRYNLWNHFSAFVVPAEHLDDVETIMIAATPRTANRQGGKRIEKINLPKRVQDLLIESRSIPRTRL